MRLINNRIYLDHNATTPLAPSVNEWLSKGVFLWANPASPHSSGKAARKIINDCKDFLFETFKLPVSEFDLIFHSGATEGINMILSSMIKQNPGEHYFFRPDHPAVIATMLAHNEHCHELQVNQNGEINPSEVVDRINESTGQKVCNFTWVNNVSGVIHPLKVARDIKNKTGAIIHVDAVQSPGRIENYNELDPELDAYTFSAHKFGALKGIGFSFIKKKHKITPLIFGGGQQQGVRSGTENVMGVQSIHLALDYLNKNHNSKSLLESRDHILQKLKDEFHKKITVVGENASHRNLNTLFLYVHTGHMDTLLAALDMNGLEVSSGSACSTGSGAPNHVMMAMGFDEDQSYHGLRISLPIECDLKFAKETADRLCTSMKNVLG